MSLSNPDAVLLGKLRGLTAEERDFLAEVWAAQPTTTSKRRILGYVVKVIYFGWPLLVLAIIAASIWHPWLTPLANTMVVMVWFVFIIGYSLSTIIANIAITQKRSSDPRLLLRLLKRDFFQMFTVKAKLATTCATTYLVVLAYTLLMAKHSTTAAALVLALCLFLAGFIRTRVLVRKNLAYCVRMVRDKPWLKDFFKTFEA